MDPLLPDHIVELAATARRAFADLGGVELARRAEADLAERARAGDALRALGAADLDPTADADQALAAFALCREAGRVALPYPVEATLCRHAGASVMLVDPAAPLVDHADLLDPMLAVDLTGRVWRAEDAGAPLGSRLAPFAAPVTLHATDRPSSDELGALAAWQWTLTSATVLGFVEAAVDECVEHARSRRQFGERIGDFQAVQFQIADAVVAATGLAELARFTAWRVIELGAAARTDALAFARPRRRRRAQRDADRATAPRRVGRRRGVRHLSVVPPGAGTAPAPRIVRPCPRPARRRHARRRLRLPVPPRRTLALTARPIGSTAECPRAPPPPTVAREHLGVDVRMRRRTPKCSEGQGQLTSG